MSFDGAKTSQNRAWGIRQCVVFVCSERPPAYFWCNIHTYFFGGRERTSQVNHWYPLIFFGVWVCVCVCLFPTHRSSAGRVVLLLWEWGNSVQDSARHEFEQLVEEAPAVNRADWLRLYVERPAPQTFSTLYPFLVEKKTANGSMGQEMSKHRFLRVHDMFLRRPGTRTL